MQKVYVNVQLTFGSKVRRGAAVLSVHEVEDAVTRNLSRMKPLELLLTRVKKDDPALYATVLRSSCRCDTSIKIDAVRHVVRVEIDYDVSLSDAAPPRSEVWWQSVARMMCLAPMSHHGLVKTLTEDQDFELGYDKVTKKDLFECEVYF